MPNSSDLTITRADAALLTAVYANAQRSYEIASEAAGAAPDLAARERLQIVAEHAGDAADACLQIVERLGAQIYAADAFRAAADAEAVTR